MADLGLPIKFFDAYELRARLAPAIFMALPLVPPVWWLGPELPGGWAALAGFGFAAILALYGLSLVVGILGYRAQPRLWRKWGGPPSTRLARWSDDRLTKARKQDLHAAVAQRFGIDLFSSRMERSRPDEADRQIGDAFKRVKQLLYRRDPNGLWSKHLAEYGFARNGLASATWGLLLSLAGVAAGLAAWRGTGEWDAFRVTCAEGAIAVILTIARIGILPPMARAKADRYAEAAWEAFLLISEEDRNAGPLGDGDAGKQADQD